MKTITLSLIALGAVLTVLSNLIDQKFSVSDDELLFLIFFVGPYILALGAYTVYRKIAKSETAFYALYITAAGEVFP